MNLWKDLLPNASETIRPSLFVKKILIFLLVRWGHTSHIYLKVRNCRYCLNRAEL
jgi:hypothetical protein